MPCISAPKIPLPPDPGVLFTPPDLPAEDVDAALCCKVSLLSTPAVPDPIPPLVLNAGVMAAIDNVLTKIENYLDKLPLVCPKE